MCGALALAGLVLGTCGPARAGEDGPNCGDQELSCGTSERCCEHVVAMFSPAGTSATPYLEGQCVPKEQRCAEFWCGNRHCQSGFFGTPSVCCIMEHPGLSTDYHCAYSELNCPGNTAQLSIRDRDQNKLVSRALHAD